MSKPFTLTPEVFKDGTALIKKESDAGKLSLSKIRNAFSKAAGFKSSADFLKVLGGQSSTPKEMRLITIYTSYAEGCNTNYAVKTLKEAKEHIFEAVGDNKDDFPYERLEMIDGLDIFHEFGDGTWVELKTNTVSLETVNDKEEDRELKRIFMVSFKDSSETMVFLDGEFYLSTYDGTDSEIPFEHLVNTVNALEGDRSILHYGQPLPDDWEYDDVAAILKEKGLIGLSRKEQDKVDSAKITAIGEVFCTLETGDFKEHLEGEYKEVLDDGRIQTVYDLIVFDDDISFFDLVSINLYESYEGLDIRSVKELLQGVYRLALEA